VCATYVQKLAEDLHLYKSHAYYVPDIVQCTCTMLSMARIGHELYIKGTVSRDILLLVFFMNQFPPTPEYSIKTVKNFFKNLRRYLQVKVHHRYQRHRRQIFPPFSLALLIPVSMIPTANLPPVSTTPVANNGNYYQTANNFKWTWKKVYLYANSTTQRFPKEIINIFSIKDYFHWPPVSLTLMANLELRISPWIFAKNSKQSYLYNQGLGGN
jgi:hypothetical protein